MPLLLLINYIPRDSLHLKKRKKKKKLPAGICDILLCFSWTLFIRFQNILFSETQI